MLKITGSLDKSVSSKNNGNRLTYSKNDNNRPVFKKNNSNGKDNGFDISKNSVKYVKKSEKLSKLEKLFELKKSKSKKTFKSQNLAKSRKKTLKSGNSTSFDTIEARLKFLTPNAKTAFNCL